MRNENKRSDATKELLKDAFWELYEKKTIDKITIREITNKAGLNRGTFYAHYLDIYDVLQQIKDNILCDMEQNSIKLFRFFFTYESDFEYFNDFITRYEKYLKVLIGKKGDPEFIYKVKDIMKRTVLVNLPENHNQTDIDYILEYIASAHIGSLNFWYENDRDKTMANLVKLIKSLSTQGPVKVLLSYIDH